MSTDEADTVPSASEEVCEYPETDSVNSQDAPKPGNMLRSNMAKSNHKKLFVDPEDMKAVVRNTLTKPAYDVKDAYHTTGVWQYVARHPVFENLTLGVISFNALWISIDSDLNPAGSLFDYQPLFQVVEHFFCVYFTFEWLVRYKAFTRKRDGLKDAWFVFDSALVGMMLVETWIMTLILAAICVEMGGSGGASLLRLLRLLRLSRLARMFRSMPELLILLKGMIASTRSVFFTLCLLVIIMYVFAIIFTQVAEGTECQALYFNSIPHSMGTLLMTGTFLDNLTQVTTDVGRCNLIFAALFFLFVLLGALTVMNMLIGVLCEVVSAVAEAEKEEMAVLAMKEKMTCIMATVDEDRSGKVSEKEFMKIIKKRDAINTLHEMGVDPVGLVEFVDYIFVADCGDTGEELPVELTQGDFMELLLNFRQCNTATVKDMVDMRKFINTKLKGLEEKMSDCFGSGPADGGRSPPREPPGMGPRVSEWPGLAGAQNLLSLSSGLEAFLEATLEALEQRSRDEATDPADELRSAAAADTDGRAELPGCLGPGLAEPPGDEALGCQRAQQLEEHATAVLSAVQKLRRALPPAGGPPSRGGGGVNGSFPAATLQRDLRVFLARLEAFFLTTWLEEPLRRGGLPSLAQELSRSLGELRKLRPRLQISRLPS